MNVAETLPLAKRNYGILSSLLSEQVADEDRFAKYRFDSARYVREVLGWEPWDGTDEQAGQLQILRAYDRAMRQQHERSLYEDGATALESLSHYDPAQPITNRLRISAGHNVGKTKLASGIVNHFFDCFVPSIAYTFAPSWLQVHDLLWKEIKADRRGKGLPGRILDLELSVGDDHFVKGRAAADTKATGTERVQGQHGKYLLFVLDEAEGIPDFIWDAVDSMASGGIVLVLMLANPRTQSSRFHRSKARRDCASFRIASTWHPNVLADRDLIPGAVRREYVDTIIDTHCTKTPAPDPDKQTFSVPWRDGIYIPDAYALFRMLGEAPANIADNVFVPYGRYQAALQRDAPENYPGVARLGVDVARFGKDYGTVYARHNGKAWNVARYAQQDTNAYAHDIIAEAKRLRALGCHSLHIRVDAGGGFGGGVVDRLANNVDLLDAWKDADLQIWECHFNGTAYSETEHYDLVTEMHATMAEVLKTIRIDNPPPELEDDLCLRTFKWVARGGHDIKRIQPKEEFKKVIGRSPDDGDGFCLAVCPDFVFQSARRTEIWVDDVEDVRISVV